MQCNRKIYTLPISEQHLAEFIVGPRDVTEK